MNVTILYMRTGGGHLSAARALRADLLALRPDARVALVDVVASYRPPVWRRLPAAYAWAARHPAVWHLWFASANGPRRRAAVARAIGGWMRAPMGRLLAEHSADAVVSVHPALNDPLALAVRELPSSRRPLAATVVTDPIGGTPLWYCPHIDLCYVSTEPAQQAALAHGLAADRVHIARFPLEPRYLGSAGGVQARKPTGSGQLTVLVTGGADGVGPLHRTVVLLRRRLPNIHVVVVTGGNRRLARRLHRLADPQSLTITAMTDDMPSLLEQADIVVTKAGPAALAEAAALGVPTVIGYSLPGPEKHNAALAATSGAALRAVGAADAVRAVGTLARSEQLRQALAVAAAGLHLPDLPTVAERLLAQLDE